jgi:hypothetical protein
MSRILQSAAVVISALAAWGCATTMNVSSHVQGGLAVAQYRTYDWGPADALPTGDPRLDKDPFFQDQLEGAVEKQLATRGLERATADQADLLIHYHANIDRRIDVNRTERQYGYCQDAGCQSWVVEYQAGTLVLDIVDARTNRLIWRGWAQDSLEGVLDNHHKMAQKITEAVGRMLAMFPKG